MSRLFFIFWIRANLFRDFSGCRRPIFKCFDIIRFVFPLAFQRSIPKCSNTKTREATAKRKWKVENDCSAFLQLLRGGGDILYTVHCTGGVFGPPQIQCVHFSGGGDFTGWICFGFFDPLLVYFLTHQAYRLKMDFRQI